MSKDLFSKHASQYAAFRPTYPQELFDFIYSHTNRFDNAWDAGTGNGQVARELSKKFQRVFATDISEGQIANATQALNINYSIAAETTNFADHTFDLICVAQAIHWFDREKFYEEVRRVAKPAATLAVWGYGLLTIDEKIDDLIRSFYKNVIGSYWDKERRLIDESYKTISFPFQEIACPPFSIDVEWNLTELHGYITTWSSVQKFIQQHQTNPVDDLIKSIQPLWQTDYREIRFPIFIRLAKV